MSDKKRSRTVYRSCDGCRYLLTVREAVYSPTEEDGKARSYRCLHEDHEDGFVGFMPVVNPEECPLADLL